MNAFILSGNTLMRSVSF